MLTCPLFSRIYPKFFRNRYFWSLLAYSSRLFMNVNLVFVCCLEWLKERIQFNFTDFSYTFDFFYVDFWRMLYFYLPVLLATSSVSDFLYHAFLFNSNDVKKLGFNVFNIQIWLESLKCLITWFIWTTLKKTFPWFALVFRAGCALLQFLIWYRRGNSESPPRPLGKHLDLRY